MNLLMPFRPQSYSAATLQGQEGWRGNGATSLYANEFRLYPNSYLRFSVDMVNPRHGWVGIRVRVGWPSTAAPEEYTRLFDCNSDAENGIHLYYCNDGFANDQKWGLKSETGFADDAFSPIVSFEEGSIHNVYAYWTPRQMGLGYNGNPYSSAARNQGIPQIGLEGHFCIGRKIEAASMWLEGEVLFFAVGEGNITDSLSMDAFLSARNPLKRLPGQSGAWLPDSGAMLRVS